MNATHQTNLTTDSLPDLRHVITDVGNHRMDIENRGLGFESCCLGLGNYYVGVQAQFGLK